MRSRPQGAGQVFLGSQSNSRRDDARAGSFLLPHQQLGTLSLGTAPSNGQVVPIVINGTTITITAVTGTPTNANDVKAPGTAAGFVSNVVNFLRRPDLSNSNQVAASAANQSLLQFVGWSYPGTTTAIVPFSLNKNANGVTGALTSFNITGITVTSGTWTAQLMQLYVEDGAYYINGTRYLFTGGSTPTVTGPVSNPRIDVLTIDTSGTLAWTTGTENASPSAPAYPASKIPICEIYNIVSETGLYDNENQQASQGYILNDVRPTVQYGIPFSGVPSDILPDATDTRQLGSSAGLEWLNIYGKNIYAASTMQLAGQNVAFSKFGGSGSDGALSISSGTTTLSFAGANFLVKNYTSISITGTAKLAVNNVPSTGGILILKSQGAVTITSSTVPCIEMSSAGGSGGAGATAGGGAGSNTTGGGGGGGGSLNAAGAAGSQNSTSGGGAENSGASGGTGIGLLNLAGGGVLGYGGGQTAQGSQGGAATTSSPLTIHGRMIMIAAGGGGGGGGGGYHLATTTHDSGGAGGNGGGGLYIECGGALNFAATINANAANGGNPSGTSGGNGGGGGGGSVLILYFSLTANTGTINTNAGSQGSGGANAGGGGAGASAVLSNTEFA